MGPKKTIKASTSGMVRHHANTKKLDVHCCAAVVVRLTASGAKVTFYPNHSGHVPAKDPFSVLPHTDACIDFVRAKLAAGLSVSQIVSEWRQVMRNPAVAACSMFAPWDGGLSDMTVRNVKQSMDPQSKYVVTGLHCCTCCVLCLTVSVPSHVCWM